MPITTRLDKNTGTEISINYEIIGEGLDTIVFHHGNGNRLEDWSTLGFVDELKDNFRLLLIDSRGYGKSSKPHDTKEYNLKSRADDTISALDNEGIEQAHCLGASVGAAACFLLAKFYPHRFKSYIFATPYFCLFDKEVQEALQIGTESYVAKLEELIGGQIENSSIRETFLSNDARALLAANTSEWFDYREYIQYITSPSLIYVGGQEPSLQELTELKDTLDKNSSYPCTLHVFPNASHAEVYWGGKMASPIIAEFIESLRCRLRCTNKM